MKNKEIAKVENQNYALQNVSPTDLSGILMEAAGSSGITAMDLDRVKIPAGGGTMWTINTLEGEETTKTIEGIILHHQDARAYWGQSLEESGGNSPPDCQSPDGITGMGTPGGNCQRCPFAAFGSDRKARGQACKAIKLIYLVTKESLLPIVLPLSPTSIKPARQYLLRLASRGMKASQVVTAFSLEKEKNADGIAYAKAVPSLVSKIDGPLLEQVASYAVAFKKSLGTVTINADDV